MGNLVACKGVHDRSSRVWTICHVFIAAPRLEAPEVVRVAAQGARASQTGRLLSDSGTLVGEVGPYHVLVNKHCVCKHFACVTRLPRDLLLTKPLLAEKFRDCALNVGGTCESCCQRLAFSGAASRAACCPAWVPAHHMPSLPSIGLSDGQRGWWSKHHTGAADVCCSGLHHTPSSNHCHI